MEKLTDEEKRWFIEEIRKSSDEDLKTQREGLQWILGKVKREQYYRAAGLTDTEEG